MGTGVDAGSMLVPEEAWLSWASMRVVADIGMSICIEASVELVIGICMPGMSECCGWAQIEKDDMRASTIEARRNMVDPFSEDVFDGQRTKNTLRYDAIQMGSDTEGNQGTEGRR